MAPPSSAQAEILRILARRGGIGLSGNRESYSDIRREGQQWLRVDGDSMTGAETMTPIDDAALLQAVFWLARDRLGHYGPDDGAVTWDDVLAWLRAGGV